jgi:N-sulfoglucosamine sulfohydrolase
MKFPLSSLTHITRGKQRGSVATVACLGAFVLAVAPDLPAAPRGVRPNFLILIADDLSYGSLGFTGGVAPGVSPHIDQLARDGFTFSRAHVTASVCQPSRQSMFSGKYPHRYGSADFWPMRAGTPTLAKRLREAGYVTAGLAKLQHMKPKADFAYEIVDEDLNLGVPLPVLGRNPALLAKGVAATIATARRRAAPFLVVVNSEDPHRPFHGDPFEADIFEDDAKLIPPPSRVFTPAEVSLPPTLPDLPGIRTDLARYASSVRRLDDTVGMCLRTLRENGVEQNTMVIFVSDNGMPLPFGKFDAYVESTRTPLIIKWPEHLRGGRTDNRRLISLVDIAPTLVELAGAQPLDDIDGHSLLPLLFGDGATVPWRTHLFTVRYEEIYYGDGLAKRERRTPGFIASLKHEGWVPRPDHEAAGTHSRPNHKRAVVDGQSVYIYNHFFDGTPRQAFPYGDASYQAMVRAAANDATLRARVEFYKFRCPEELYDYAKDPGYYRNLATQPESAAQLREARARLARWMQETADPVARDFEKFLAPPRAR